MHIYGFIRGKQAQVEDLKCLLQGQMFNMPQKDLQGNPMKRAVQGVWRPIEFGEYIIPKEAYPEVYYNMGLQDAEAWENSFKKKMEMEIFRKALGAKKLIKPALTDEEKGNLPYRLMRVNNAYFHPIGIKEDRELTFKQMVVDEVGITHEAL